ncbi:amino acid adenylation domain-containing protein [Tumebacillus sp. BK434]|uniref:amino acid adenylation domain-containing protein n=1 Tax=Tumebacillus sp. BK434 TaxID=2512169 RepID=UPI00104B0454|nr:non-ribosomal peptide synthetase [Tumebacillus sp. BK434]TCP59164.1 amino acid adenylation domain-containing protein [Tumebacillus sp. BK434]
MEHTLQTLPLVQVPSDLPRGGAHTSADFTLKLSSALQQELKTFAEAAGLSELRILLTVFQMLIHRYTGEEEIAVLARGAENGVTALAGGVSAGSTLGEMLQAGRLHEMELSTESAPPMLLEFTEGQVTWTYDGARYSQELIARMGGHFLQLLQGALQEPETFVCRLPLLTAQEERELTADESPLTGGDAALLHLQVEAQAQRFPDKVALEFQGSTMTYRELSERSNRLAHYLQTLGVGPDVLVGLCLERSLDVVVAVLGILKAGGAYVPLDPKLPQERIRFMLEDAAANVLVTRNSLLALLPETDSRAVALDGDAEKIAIMPSTLPERGAAGHHLAYLIYTSGSTGKPKAVMVEHQNVISTLDAAIATFGYTPDDVMPFIASLAFDVSVFEMFNPLITGGKTVILTQEEVLDFPRLIEKLKGYTILHTVPSVMRQICDTILEQGEPSGEYRSMRVLLVGGDVVPPDLLERMHAAFPMANVHVMYGPTEGAIICSTHPVRRGAKPDGYPIGTRLTNAWLRIYDGQRNLLPLGMPGELYIGGHGVTRGYRGRDDLTADKFVELDGVRWYRTGDLVRRMADGTIDFLGRIDNQVKIRGFRIEIGEIETQLAALEGIAETLVMARDDAAGEKQLVAYVVTHSGAPIPTAVLREHLQTSLPYYMVPSAFVFLERFPLNANAKIDRKQLPDPVWISEEPYEAARNETEALLCSVYSEVLRSGRIGIHDSFFDLGGNSLLATQVISRVRRSCGVELQQQHVLDAPTVAGLAETVQSLQDSGAGLKFPPIERMARGGALPLSYAQQRMWFLDEMGGASGLYNVAYALRLKGVPEFTALRMSLATVIARHEPLRTTYQEIEGVLQQVIDPWERSERFAVDIRLRGAADYPADVMKFLTEEAQRPFDLQTDLALRAVYVEVAEEESLLLLTMPHIAADGWSMGVILEEFAESYAHFLNGDTRSHQHDIEYVDFAAWQREFLQGGVMDEQLAYWKQKLQGAPALLELPLDKPRPAVQSHRGAVEFLHLEAELTARLEALARQANATLYMVLLAAFQTLLYRYTGQTDLPVGSPIAGRHYPGVEKLVGLFVNTLVMRGDVSGDPTAFELLSRVRATTMEAYQHQDLPFDKLVEELQPERDLSYLPLCQTFFALQNMPMAEFSAPRLTASPFDLELSVAKFDLAVVMEERQGGLMARFEYATDLFDAKTICRMKGHFAELLRGIAAAPERRVSELPMLSPAERAELLAGEAEFAAPEHCVYQLFEAQAERTPDAVALQLAGDTMSYRELNARANRLAHHLLELGVTAETRVGVFLQRSPDVAVALLAVHKAGGAYVPFDPKHPQERIQFMLEDAAAPVVITQETLAGRLPQTDAHLVRIDRDWSCISAQPDHNPEVETGGEQLAYLLYTSGSTGRPKAVMVEHRNLASTLMASVEEFGFRAGDVMPWTASVAFDIAQFELFCPLLVGGTAVILPEEVLLDFPRLADEVQRCTAMFAVPSLMRQLALSMREEGRDPADYAKMRLLFCGGDAVYADLLAMLHESFPQADAYVLYGPTEGTILCTQYLAPREALPERAMLGTNLKNANIRLCDPHGNLVPTGVPGELVLGGAGVARGYQGQEALTSEKFVTMDGTRWYRTGDAVRRLADGTLEFLGRLDNQVKIRGFRIEIGEIEAALARHEAVGEAAVIVREDAPGDKRLAAYVVGRDEVTADELRRHLQATLPEYMVPSGFVFLDAFPLNPNGKIDRNNLPRPAEEDSEHTAGVQARTQEEELIGGVFAQVLDLPGVGRDDHFFALGGHSLLATQAVSRLRKLFGVELPVKALFQAPTVAQMAVEIKRLGRGADLPPITRAARDAALPLSFNQRRLWFIEQVQNSDGLYHIPLLIRMQGELDRAALQHSLQKLVRRHEALRTVFVEVDGEPMQQVLADLELPLQIHGGVAEAELLPLVRAEAKLPFDLVHGPLVRADLYERQDGEQYLLLNLHHIIADGWSVEFFMQELAEVYTAHLEHRVPQLPEVTLGFADVAKWEQDALQGDVLEQKWAYWKQKLAGHLAPLDLPTDRPRPEGQTHVGAQHKRWLPAELVPPLQELARREGVSLYMLLLAAFNVLLFRTTGQTDIAVGSPSAGRERAEVERVFGFFVNTLVLRSDLSGSPLFTELMHRVREVTLDALAHQEVPFERLLELQPQTDRRYAPLIQAMFVLQDVGFSQRELPGMVWELVEFDLGIAKFDLTLYVEETEEGLKAMAEYNTDLFDAATIDRLLQQWQGLLESIAEDPRRSIGELPLQGAAEVSLSEDEFEELFL